MEGLHNRDLITLFVGTIIRFVSDGHLAVIIFFVISGLALSIKNLNKENRKLELAASSRYFRLAIPVFFTSLIAYILFKLGLMFNSAVAALSESPVHWLGGFYRFELTIFEVIKFSLRDVFLPGGPDFVNPILWTMNYELLRSFVIYAYLGIFRSAGKVQWPIVIILTVMLFLSKPLLSCFFIGYMIAEITKSVNINSFLNKIKSRYREMFFGMIFLTSAVLSAYVRGSDRWSCLFGAGIVVSICFSVKLKCFFSNSASRFLGGISFPLYLIQIPLICSWTSYLYIELPELGLERINANLVNLFSTIILALLSARLLLPLESLSIRYSKKIGSYLIKN